MYMVMVDGRDVNTVQSEAEARCVDHFRKRYGAKFDPGRFNVRKDLLYIEARGGSATREVACYRCFLTCEYEEARDLEAFLKRYEAALDSAMREVNRGNLPAALTGLLDAYDLLGEGMRGYLRTERLETERQALRGALNALLASVSLRFSRDALSVDGRTFEGVDLEVAGTFRYMDRSVRASGLPVGLSAAGGTLSATRVVLEDGAGRVRFSGPGLRATNRLTVRFQPGEGLVRRLQGYPEFRDAYQGMMGRSAVCTVSVSHLTYGVLFDWATHS